MARKPTSIIECYNPEAPASTEFRRLLYRIRNHGDERELKSLLVTSAMLSEGKSTTCAFLAITASLHKGMKALIIDADLRRPNIHKLFAVPRERGLTEILADGFGSMDAVKKTPIDKLDVITSGVACPNPAIIFDAESIGAVIDEMKFYYDLILIDSPPVIPVSDPMLLSARVDGLLLVVRAGSTQKEVANRAVQILSADGDKLIGIVLNDMERVLPFEYDYGYYGYEYNQLKSPKKAGPGIRKNRKGPSKDDRRDRIAGQPGRPK